MSQPPDQVDAVIVGQGLAGTSLAWCFLRRGARILVIDRAEPFTASRVAPGLITPITGKRLKRSWQWTEFWPAARDFYRSLEITTETQFLHLRPALRLFLSAAEREQFQQQLEQGEFAGLEVQDIAPNSLPGLAAPWGGFEMQPAGNLNVAAFLQASAKVFSADAHRWEGTIAYDQIDLETRTIRIAGHSVQTTHLIFCEGWKGSQNPWLRQVPFRPAKGELLRVHIPGWSEQRTVHAGKWLAPVTTDQYWAGSTYEWNQLDCSPTEQGRSDILHGIDRFLVKPAQILEHVAGVRPAVSDSHPVIGRHPEIPWFGFLNGLGTKGVLHAPLMAQRLCELLLEGTEPPPEVSLSRW